MSGKAKINVPMDRIATYCKARHIRRLALFGSVLSDRFNKVMSSAEVQYAA